MDRIVSFLQVTQFKKHFQEDSPVHHFQLKILHEFSSWIEVLLNGIVHNDMWMKRKSDKCEYTYKPKIFDFNFKLKSGI